MLPAVVALVLGAARVQTQLADASRLSTIRDQLTVVHGAVTLAELVAGESVAAVADLPDHAVILDRRIAEVDVLDDLVAELVDDVSTTVTDRTRQARAEALRDTAIVLGALLAALAVALLVARSMLRPIRALRAAAHTAATEQLPEVVTRVRAGEFVDYRETAPVPVHTGEEIGQLARAFDNMHQQAVKLAGEQAELRLQVSEMFMTLSRRSQSLVELQLDLLEGLESDEQDPRRLDELVKLDHLATRLRRNGENLQVLAGGTPARRGHDAITVVELLRAATSEVDDYRRVTLGTVPSGSIRSAPAADVVHILAELLENATRLSPPDRKIVLTADRAADGGLLVEVIDTGLGMPPDDLAAANAGLRADAAVGPETTRRMGLFVVSRLAARHGVTVRLRHTVENTTQEGTTASVHVPGSLVVADGMPEPAPEPPTRELAPALATLAAQPVPPMRTPIFDTLASNWFAEPTGDDPARSWNTAADEAWRAAAAAAAADRPVPDATTEAGPPMRGPGARAVPSGPESSPATSVIDVRDAESVRHNLSRHHHGLRAARERATTRTDAGDEA